MVVVGMSWFGVPLSSANPSSNSSRRGGSTSSTCHQPWDWSPSGPVMKYVTRPPGVRSWSTTVAG